MRKSANTEQNDIAIVINESGGQLRHNHKHLNTRTLNINNRPGSDDTTKATLGTTETIKSVPK